MLNLNWFKNNKGNWTCLCAGGDMITANGKLTEKEIIVALENGEGKTMPGRTPGTTNYIIGFGNETMTTAVKELKLAKSAEADLPVIDWTTV